tara:strand:- start:1793 stop:2227 length:435 start_codon:yes stop_codon:yes gene_type:complete
VQIIREPKTLKEWEDYYNLRWEILRSPLNLGKGSEKDDLEDSAIHRAIFENEKVIGIGRLHFIDKETAQIRYMAVLEECRGKGLGRMIVEEFAQISEKNKIFKIILYARESVIEFYKKLGFETIKKAHRLESIQHFLMERKIFS